MIFADQIARNGLVPDPAASAETANQIEAVASLITACRAVRADNVCDLIYQQDREEFSIEKDFPCLAPPFPELWIEWHEPTSWNSLGRLQVSSLPPGLRRGALVTATDISEARDRVRSEVLSQPLILRGPGDPDCARWRLTFRSVDQLRGLHPWWTQIFVDNGGLVVAAGAVTHTGVFPDAYWSRHHFGRDPDGGFTWAPSIFVAAMTISLMNCSNVTAREVAPDERLQRRAAKRKRPPLTSYYVLELDGIRREMDKAIGTGATLAQRLHACRGHFKDYRRSGLFGKLKGIYWWDPAMRGNAENGSVHKDYAVAPAGDGQENRP